MDEIFKEELEDITDDMTKLNQEKVNKNPGHAVKRMLMQWSEEPV